MFHRLNDKGDNSLTEIPGCPEKRIATKLWWKGPLPKLCPVIPTSNQDGRQAKNRKKGGCNFNCPLLL
jgi:hypothetical protein